MSGQVQGGRVVAWRNLGAGISGAALTVLLLFIWFQIRHWVIWGSAYTDLPGQDSTTLVLNLEKYVVIGLIALIAGRVGGVLCRTAGWLAALLSVSPLLVLFTVSGTPFNQWFWYILAPLLALVGAYVPVWPSRSRRQSTGASPKAASA